MNFSLARSFSASSVLRMSLMMTLLAMALPVLTGCHSRRSQLATIEKRHQADYEAIYDKWEASVNRQLHQGSSFITGDDVALAQLRHCPQEHLPFLKSKLQDNFFVVWILEGQESRLGVEPITGNLPDRQQAWLGAISQHNSRHRQTRLAK